MLSIEECRKLIPDHDQYTDKQIEEIRDDFRTLAELAWEKWEKDRGVQRASTLDS